MDATLLPFLHAIEPLKHIPRTGWLRTIQNPESVAAHSFRVAILAMLAPDNLKLDRSKCIQMALVHDLAESVIGDIPTFAKVPKERKYEMERNGFQYLENLLRTYDSKKAEEISELWLEYEKGETPESQWVREMDKFECLVQAHEYEQRTFGKKDLNEFQGLSAKIHSEEARQWVKFLSREREEHLAKRKRRQRISFITGDTAACENVASYISEKLSFPHISVSRMLTEKARDPEYRHHGIIEKCLDKGFEVPASLIVELIENEIKDIGEWTIISGFPNDKEQLAEFEKKVSTSYYAVYLECPPLATIQGQKTAVLEYAEHMWKPSVVEFKNALKDSAVDFEMHGSDNDQLTISEPDLCELAMGSIGAFVGLDSKLKGR